MFRGVPTAEKGVNSITGSYGTPSLKNQYFENRFLHAREDQRIGLEPNIQIVMNLGPLKVRVDNQNGLKLTF